MRIHRHLTAFGLLVAASATAAGGPTGDGAARMVVLPVVVEGDAGASAADLSRVLSEAARSAAGLPTAPAPTPLDTDGRCRRDLACTAGHLPEGALAFDLRLFRPAADAPHVAFDLRLIRGGRLLSRTSATVRRDELLGAVADAASRLLVPVAPELRLYRLAVAGNAEAARRLVAEHPEGAWTRAFLLEAAAVDHDD